MVRREDIKVKPGFEFDHFFPRAKLITITKKKGATVEDTLRLIPAVVQETLFHTKSFAGEVIDADTLEQTCRNLWQFVTDHIAYKKDETGKEQVRSPARTWHDRHNTNENGEPMGVDCDCYTVFISSVLSNLNIKHKLRITKYGEDHFQHIYPIVPTGNGRYITIDCVVSSFDYEEPFTEKKDTDMDLEYLNGVENSSQYKITSDSQDLMGMMDEREALAELGKLFKKKTSEQKAQRRQKIKKFVNKGLHLTNRLNPATVALRNGVLAAMKLNFMKIGEQLKYTYLSDEEAQKRGLVMDRFHKMKKIREKLEKIFYGAGGKPENLKKAILTGHGNKHRDVPVNGLGYPYENIEGLNEDMPLSQLLGRDLYSSENVEGMEEFNGFGELGEPVTAATIAAATTVLTTIAALIKSVGSLKPKAGGKKGSGDDGGGGGGGGSTDDNSSSNDASNNSSDNSSSNSNSSDQSSNSSSNDDAGTNGSTNKTVAKTSAPSSNNSSSNGGGDSTDSGSDDGADQSSRKMLPAKTTGDDTADDTKKPSFWENNKKWIKPVGIGVGSLGLIVLMYQLLKPKKKSPAVNGTPRKRKPKQDLLSGIPAKKKKGGHKSVKRKKKKVITLL